MQFRTPTTLEEVYDILKEIFHYYRLNRQIVEEVELPTLSLPRLSETYFDIDIWQEAKSDLAGKQEREKLERRTTLKEKLDLVKNKIKTIDARFQVIREAVLDGYRKDKEELIEFARKAGIHQSNILADNLVKLNDAKEEKLAKIESDKSAQLYDWLAESEALQTQYESVENHFKYMFDNEITSKSRELTVWLKEKKLQIDKYNNDLYEKEQRFNASMEKSRAELKIKLLQAAEEPLTKDQLIEMGYYKDVIACITSYFDTLPPTEAFALFNSEPNLAIYLEDYYHGILYMYQLRIPAN